MNKPMKVATLWVIILLPFLYLLMIWDQLPQTVPIHFNIKGEADGWSDKTMLIYLPCLLGPGIYLLMLLLPRIDPKNKLAQMGDNYFMITMIITIFMSALSLYILYVSKSGSMTGPSALYIIAGAFFAGLGNYLQAVRPNYFVGIRTPWTLENEEVWKRTHRLGGKIWMAGGLMIIAATVLVQNKDIVFGVFIGLIAIMVIAPMVYSYLLFKKLSL